MSYIRIGDEQRNIADADEQWLGEQLRRRKAVGGNTCIQIALILRGNVIPWNNISYLDR